MKKILGVFFVATLLFSGCGTDDDSVQSLTITGASGNQVALDGQWGQGCDAESITRVHTISGSSFTHVGNDWENSADCSGQSDMTESVSASFTLGGEVTALMNGSPVTATKLDAVVSSALITPNTSTGADSLNAESKCGATDWVAGTAKDVLGTDCIGTSFKDILYIDDTVNPNLWYGGMWEHHGGTMDANGYPEVLDPSNPKARL